MSEVSLTASVRSNLLTLQDTADKLETVTERLSSGKEVASAIDNPTNYFAAENYNESADSLDSRLDSMSEATEMINAADNGITNIKSFLSQMKGVVNNALSNTDSTDRRSLGEQFNELVTQVRDMAQDSGYGGINLLYDNASTTVEFGEEIGQSTLDLQGFNISAASGEVDANGEINGSRVKDADGESYALTIDASGDDVVGLKSAGLGEKKTVAASIDNIQDSLADLAKQTTVENTELQASIYTAATDTTEASGMVLDVQSILNDETSGGTYAITYTAAKDATATTEATNGSISITFTNEDDATDVSTVYTYTYGGDDDNTDDLSEDLSDVAAAALQSLQDLADLDIGATQAELDSAAAAEDIQTKVDGLIPADDTVTTITRASLEAAISTTTTVEGVSTTTGVASDLGTILTNQLDDGYTYTVTYTNASDLQTDGTAAANGSFTISKVDEDNNSTDVYSYTTKTSDGSADTSGTTGGDTWLSANVTSGTAASDALSVLQGLTALDDGVNATTAQQASIATIQTAYDTVTDADSTIGEVETAIGSNATTGTIATVISMIDAETADTANSAWAALDWTGATATVVAGSGDSADGSVIIANKSSSEDVAITINGTSVSISTGGSTYSLDTLSDATSNALNALQALVKADVKSSGTSTELTGTSITDLGTAATSYLDYNSAVDVSDVEGIDTKTLDNDDDAATHTISQTALKGDGTAADTSINADLESYNSDNATLLDDWEIDWGGEDYQDTLAAVVSQIEGLESSLQTQSSGLANNLSVITTRQDFTEEKINILNDGADNLTLADLNEEGANLLSLQTSESLAVQSLSLASNTSSTVLQLIS